MRVFFTGVRRDGGFSASGLEKRSSIKRETKSTSLVSLLRSFLQLDQQERKQCSIVYNIDKGDVIQCVFGPI